MCGSNKIMDADNMIMTLRSTMLYLRDSEHSVSPEVKECAVDACIEAEKGIQAKDIEGACRPLYAAAAGYLPDYAGIARQLIDLGGRAADTVEANKY